MKRNTQVITDLLNVIKEEIDTAIHKGYEYVSINRDGSVYLYEHKPFIEDQAWRAKGLYKKLAKLDKYDNWKNSLHRLVYELPASNINWHTHSFCGSHGTWVGYVKHAITGNDIPMFEINLKADGVYLSLYNEGIVLSYESCPVSIPVYEMIVRLRNKAEQYYAQVRKITEEFS